MNERCSKVLTESIIVRCGGLHSLMSFSDGDVGQPAVGGGNGGIR